MKTELNDYNWYEKVYNMGLLIGIILGVVGTLFTLSIIFLIMSL